MLAKKGRLNTDEDAWVLSKRPSQHFLSQDVCRPDDLPLVDYKATRCLPGGFMSGLLWTCATANSFNGLLNILVTDTVTRVEQFKKKFGAHHAPSQTTSDRRRAWLKRKNVYVNQTARKLRGNVSTYYVTASSARNTDMWAHFSNVYATFDHFPLRGILSNERESTTSFCQCWAFLFQLTSLRNLHWLREPISVQNSNTTKKQLLWIIPSFASRHAAGQEEPLHWCSLSGKPC